MTTARQVVKRVLSSFFLLMLAKLKPRMLSRRAAERKVRRLSGGRVASGPFKGMKYLRKTSDDAHYAARLLGTYEMELAPLMKALRLSFSPASSSWVLQKDITLSGLHSGTRGHRCLPSRRLTVASVF
jgi:hypothetical protein